MCIRDSAWFDRLWYNRAASGTEYTSDAEVYTDPSPLRLSLIHISLIPLAIKGVKYRPLGAGPLLRRNLLIYGLGGIIVPFPGIKLIDMLLSVVGWA